MVRGHSGSARDVDCPAAPSSVGVRMALAIVYSTACSPRSAPRATAPTSSLTSHPLKPRRAR